MIFMSKRSSETPLQKCRDKIFQPLVWVSDRQWILLRGFATPTVLEITFWERAVYFLSGWCDDYKIEPPPTHPPTHTHP